MKTIGKYIVKGLKIYFRGYELMTKAKYNL